MKENLKRTNKINFWHIALISFAMIFAIAIIVNIRALATDEENNEAEADENSANVTYVTTSDGYNIPVPDGYTASQVEGETNGSTGFVIYEGNIDWNTVLSDEKVSDWNAVIYGSGSSDGSSGDGTSSNDSSSDGNASEVTTSGILLASEDGNEGIDSENTSNSEETISSETGESVEENIQEQAEETNASEEIESIEETEVATAEITEETQNEDNSEDENVESPDSQDEQTEENEIDEEQETSENETSSESGGSTNDEGISVVSDEDEDEDGDGEEEEEEELTQEEINILNLQTKVNQYVWVPVETPSRIYGVDSSGKLWGKLYSSWGTTRKEYNWSESDGKISITSLTSYREPDVTHYNTSYDIDSKLNSYLDGDTQYELLSEELEQSFCKIMQSIEKYGGFYIGRYETGELSSSNSNTAVVRKMDTSISSVTWYVMYEQCKSLGYENDNVETSMIWGCLWDETLQWFLESGATDSNGDTVSVTNSTSWGNYSNSYSLFSYYTSSSTWEKATLTSSGKIPAGSSDYTKVNNIYDMAGNVWDWTLEAIYTVYRVFHGGSYDNSGSSSPASGRYDHFPTYSNTQFGCRSVLYIK